MRVIAGTAKGTRLKVPRGRLVRPTADRVKEALFSIISAKVSNARVLDLYAGCGSLGIEALSRGASLAIFIDQSNVAARTVMENLTMTSLLPKAQVLQERVLEGIEQLAISCETKQFDLIFLDPPFRINMIELQTVLSNLAQSGLAKEESAIILEHSSKVEAPKVSGIKLELDKRYGDTTLSFYKST